MPENLKSGKIVLEMQFGEAEVKQPAQQPKEKYSTLLPSDTVERLKVYAVRHRMKDWEVVDAALRAYLRDRE